MNWGEIFIQSYIIFVGLVGIITISIFLTNEKGGLKNSLIILLLSGLVVSSLMIGSGIWFLVKELM
jgi:hypothetical protein